MTLLSASVVQAGYEPPNAGAYFYSDLKAEVNRFQYEIEGKLGSKKVPVKMFLSTNEFTSGIYTDYCSFPGTCNVNNLINIVDSETRRIVEGSEDTKVSVHAFE